MKIYMFLCVVFLLIGCQNNEVMLQAHDSKLDCHMCPGYLVVDKNNLTDTIKIGSWGKVQGDYYVTKILDKDYVVVNSPYFSGGRTERSLLIYSTLKDSFLDRVFLKRFSEKEEKYTELENGLYRLDQITRQFKFSFQENTLIVDVDSTLSYLVEPSLDLIQISNGLSQDIFKVFEDDQGIDTLYEK